MAGPGRGHTGKILGLLDLIDDHGEAIEFDLITLGLRLRNLGSKNFSWRDLYVIVTHLPASSATHRSVLGDEETEWTLTNHLLAGIAEGIGWLKWAKTKDGERNRNQPKQIPRPGVKDETHRITGTAEPIEDILKKFGMSDSWNLN